MSPFITFLVPTFSAPLSVPPTSGPITLSHTAPSWGRGVGGSPGCWPCSPGEWGWLSRWDRGLPAAGCRAQMVPVLECGKGNAIGFPGLDGVKSEAAGLCGSALLGGGVEADGGSRPKLGWELLGAGWGSVYLKRGKGPELVHFSRRCWARWALGVTTCFPSVFCSCTLPTLSSQRPPGGDVGQIQPPCLSSPL